MSARVTSRAYGGYYGSRAHLETMARRTKFPNDMRRAMPTRVHPREGLSRLGLIHVSIERHATFASGDNPVNGLWRTAQITTDLAQ